MRISFRSATKTAAALAAGAACWLAVATAAGAVTLYDGSSSNDPSSVTLSGMSPDSGTALAFPSDSIQLSWRAVPGAATYDVQVARQNDSSSDCGASTAFQPDNIAATVTTADTSWVPTMVDANSGSNIWTGTYCWRVRTAGGSWSSGLSFTNSWSSTPTGLRFYNDTDGAIPRTSADSDYYSGSTTTKNAGYLSWNRVSGAATYDVQVSTSRSFSPNSILVSRDGIADSKVTLLHLPDDTYYWRARAVSANGTEGDWSTAANAFTVRWLDSDWSSPAKLYPDDSSLQTEMRIGWTPMPGAAYYEYQISTDAGCFWEPTYPNTAPDAYGDWVNYEPDPGDQWTADPAPGQCRISKVGASTINNWVTLQEAMDEAVFANIANTCLDASNNVLCERASFPDNQVHDFGAIFHLPGEVVGAPTPSSPPFGDGQFGDAHSIWWRARPVYTLKQGYESGWAVSNDLNVYGSWTRYRQAGENREHTFEIDDTLPGQWPTTSVGTRCPGTINTTVNECLEHTGSTMQADEAPGEADAGTMQFPLLQWSAFLGAGGYVVQIARDPDFTNLALTDYTPGIKTMGYGFQYSYALPDSLPDNSEGTGYWWRVIPCTSSQPTPTSGITNCVPFYSMASGGLPLSQDPSGSSDLGVAQTFTKRTDIQTTVNTSFVGASPLLSWARAGTSATDYPERARGIDGSAYYEVQLARNPQMTDREFSINTTAARVVPFQADADGAEPGESAELADGIWYFRVRAIDRDGLTGSWSDVSSFDKRIAAPTTSGGSSGSGTNVSWTAVPGADTYTFEYAADSAFGSGTVSNSTKQTAFRIPNTAVGTMYYRVRANVGGVAGQWSSTGSSAIVAATKIRYGLNKSLTYAKEKVTVTGELSIAGTPRNGKLLQLQRKNAACSASGSYSQVAQGTTGARADDGVTEIPLKVTQNNCVRLAWAESGSVHYSAPIPVKVAPRVTAKLATTKVARGKNFCARVSSTAAINGRIRVQYKYGKKWYTSRSSTVRSKTKFTQCATINRAGKFPVRLSIDRMTPRGKSWKQFEDVNVNAGSIRINNQFYIVR